MYNGSFVDCIHVCVSVLYVLVIPLSYLVISSNGVSVDALASRFNVHTPLVLMPKLSSTEHQDKLQRALDTYTKVDARIRGECGTVARVPVCLSVRLYVYLLVSVYLCLCSHHVTVSNSLRLGTLTLL